jgi:hypothetical protein
MVYVDENAQEQICTRKDESGWQLESLTGVATCKHATGQATQGFQTDISALIRCLVL